MSNHSSSQAIEPLSEEPNFSVATSDLVVNVLWFMSLTLSIAVTLITMQAKEWRHSFMAGRTGDMHERVRRRQLKLEGLKRWKMERVLSLMPLMMQLALREPFPFH